MKIDVLDHGFVRLVDSMGSDLAISRAARVSYDAPPREEDSKLIRYLIRNRHTSPLESVVFTFEVKAPIFVLRQWHRHRTWSYNELSARYRPLPEEFYVPEPDQIGEQAKHNKQMRTMGERSDAEHIREAMTSAMRSSYAAYEDLLRAGVPRELARSVLPLSMYSHMFATVNLHNLLHFIKLRNHEHAQYEIRVYARALLDLIRPVVPQAVAAWDELNSERGV